jgi:hypothetical protein
VKSGALIFSGILLIAAATAGWSESVFDPRFHTIFRGEKAFLLTRTCTGIPGAFTKKVSGAWTPGDTDITQLEDRLPGALWHAIHNTPWIGPETQADLSMTISNHVLQYGGLVVAGRKLIFVNAALAHQIDFDGTDIALPASHPAWRTTEPLSVCDAGPSQFATTYDPVTQRFGDFWFAGTYVGHHAP